MILATITLAALLAAIVTFLLAVWQCGRDYASPAWIAWCFVTGILLVVSGCFFVAWIVTRLTA